MPQSNEKLLVICKRAPDGTVEIPIMGEFGLNVLAEWILQDLMWLKPEAVKFVIYSPGGQVFDALAIYGYLKANGIKSYTEIYGCAASAATVLAAHSGPKNTSMAPGSMFMIHNASGPDHSIVDDVNKQLVDIYSEAYGWGKRATAEYMSAGNGDGTTWFAEDAKQVGICTEVMADAKVAAHSNINSTAMAENTRKVKVMATLHLTTMEAARAAFSKEGTKAEVELDLDKVAADALAEAEQKVKDAEAEVERIKAEQATKDTELATAKEQAANAATEVTNMKGQITAKEAEIEQLKAKLATPTEPATTGDNKTAAVGAMPNTEELSPIQKILKQELANTSSVEKATALKGQKV